MRGHICLAFDHQRCKKQNWTKVQDKSLTMQTATKFFKIEIILHKRLSHVLLRTTVIYGTLCNVHILCSETPGVIDVEFSYISMEPFIFCRRHKNYRNMELYLTRFPR